MTRQRRAISTRFRDRGYRFLVTPQREAAPAVAVDAGGDHAQAPLALGAGNRVCCNLSNRMVSDRVARIVRSRSLWPRRIIASRFCLSKNLSPDPANVFFADGMHEEILSNLANVANLEVISRTTMMQYRGSR